MIHVLCEYLETAFRQLRQEKFLIDFDGFNCYEYPVLLVKNNNNNFILL